MSYNSDILILSSDYLNARMHGGFAAVQVAASTYPQKPTCDRSGRKAGAVRDRSFLSPRPARSLSPGALIAPLFLRPLTPALWSAMILASQFSVTCGAGGAVPSGTKLEPVWNSQHSDFFAISSRFQRFHVWASRDAREGVRVHSRAYTCAREAGTLEPCLTMVIYHRVNGSRAVPERFHLGTGGAQIAENGGSLPFSIKIGCRYWLDLALVPSSTVKRGRSAQTFEVGRADRSISVLEQLLDQVLVMIAENGGFLPFLCAPLDHVGRVMLEGWPQGLGFARFVGSAPLPVRLARLAGHQASIGLEAPPVPPFGSAPCSTRCW